MEAVVSRLEAVAARLEAVAAGSAGPAADPEVPPEGYLAFKEVFDGTFAEFLKSWSKAVDGSYDVDKAELAPNQLKKAFECVLGYLKVTAKAKKPTQQEMQTVLKPLMEVQDVVTKLTRTRNKKLRNFDDHHTAALRIVEALFFVVHYPPSLPAAHFASCSDSVETIMLKFWKKGTDGDKEFRKAANAFVKPIPDLIKKFYKTGVEFSGKVSILEAEAPADAPAPAAAAEPVKADPGKAEEAVEAKAEKKKKEVDPDALLSSLSKGLSATKGLKKVEKSMKNKYKKEKVKGTVKGGPTKAKIKKKKEAKVKKAGPFTWQFFDFQNKDLEEINDDGKYTIKTQLYFADCINTNFKISNKVKQITLDSCKRVQIQIDEPLVSAIEVVNCKNVTVWCMNTVPTISLEKSDSPKLFMSEKAWKDAETKPQIMYSGCTAANVVFADGENQTEVPLPEQFIITGVGEDGKATITTAEHGD